LPHHRLRSCCLVIVALAAAGAHAQSPPRLRLADGDRVVLIGSTFVERDQSYGYLETALTARFHRQHIQFRNLGWSGDNVLGEARARFGKPAVGFAHLESHVTALQPTVILLSYGANESFAGADGLPSFVEGMQTLLAMLDKTKAQIVFLTPTPHEDLGRPLPDPAEHNRQLKLYSDAIVKLAAARQARVVNLFELLGAKLQPAAEGPLTDNGLHLTAYGYWRAAPVIEQALGLPARTWHIEIDPAKRNIAARGVSIADVHFADGAIRFAATDEQLPLAPAPSDAPAGSRASADQRVIRVFDLPPGQYALSVDGERLAQNSNEVWRDGVTIHTGPDFVQAEKLRQLTLKKNELYFYRWRPQNETYLFGFRKHEQGKNAVEIPQFDPLVEAAEAEIHSASAPVARRYEITRVEQP
jgi:lysophospholipase L1-like esterase